MIAAQEDIYDIVSTVLREDKWQMFECKPEGAFYKPFKWLCGGKIVNLTGKGHPAMFREAAASERLSLAECVMEDFIEEKLDIAILPESFKSSIRQRDMDPLFILEEYARCTWRDRRTGANTTPTTWVEVNALAWTMGIVIRIVRDPNDPYFDPKDPDRDGYVADSDGYEADIDEKKHPRVFGLRRPSHLRSDTVLALMYVLHPGGGLSFRLKPE